MRTWSRGSKGLHAYRGFEILNENGEILVIADSSWVLYDNKDKKIIKPLGDMKYGIIERKMFDDAKVKIDIPLKINNEIKYIVQRRDIDTNNHTNNVRYSDFILESIPEEVYEKKQIHCFEMIYKKQTFYEEELTISTTKLEENTYATVIRNEEGEICTICRTVWK